ncbi:MAG: leucyl/phenylalanyl-tRNA--protein transferase [Nocardioidaceae bacterium]|nr:leucyl/phenylalanyl-tRNA--protein transferase [Nocardioidaceae bacterium]MCL2614198.1 leucyl/phenylalanyl-tRNA--protein transferase [Nocardioidaceae bacterium]
MPIEPPPTPWVFPSRAELSALKAVSSDTSDDDLDDSDLVAVGADLEPGTLLAAYRAGLFPMPEGRRSVGWWCPARRGVLELADLRVSRSLRRSTRDFEIRVDTDFEQVVDGCADPSRQGGWIDTRIKAAYVELHRLGWAHSIEAWRGGRLAGGLYGVVVGGLFAGESMFHRERDASKVALVGLVELLASDERGAPGSRMIDVQWATPHLRSLGVSTLPRAVYLDRLGRLLAVPHPDILRRADNR